MTDTSTYYQVVEKVRDTWVTDQIVFTGGPENASFTPSSPFSITVRSEVNARTEWDTGSSTGVLDKYWINLDCNVTVPTAGSPKLFPMLNDEFTDWSLKSLAFTVKQVGGEAAGLVAQLPGTPAIDSKLVQAPSKPNCPNSAPQNTISTTTCDASMSESVGLSAGFFGETPTMTGSESFTTTNSESRAVPDISIQNLCQEDTALFVFGYTGFLPAGKENIQPCMQMILESEDDLLGARSDALKAVKTARVAIFQISVEIVLALRFQIDSDTVEITPVSARFQRYVATRMAPLPRKTN